jgi:hypothetical protein
MGGVTVFCPSLLDYCVTALESYFCVGLFEQISDFSDFRTMVGEGSSFFLFAVVIICLVRV